MADDVNIKISGDASKVEKSFDSLNKKVAQLEEKLQKTSKASKGVASDGDKAFSSLLKGAIGYGAALTAIVGSFNSIIAKAKEVKQIEDTATVSIDSSLRGVYKELNLTDEKRQDAVKNKIFDLALKKKLNIKDVSSYFQSATNAGLSEKDLVGGQADVGLDLLSTTQVDPKAIYNMIMAVALKQGNKSPDAKAQKEIVGKLSLLGEDLPDFQKLIAHGEGIKNISVDELLVLFDVAQKKKGEDKKLTISAITSAFQGTGGKGKALKILGITPEELKQRSEKISASGEESNLAKTLIESKSRSAESRLAQAEQDIGFEKQDKQDKLEETKRKERILREQQEGMNYLARSFADMMANAMGEDRYRKTKEIFDDSFN